MFTVASHFSSCCGVEHKSSTGQVSVLSLGYQKARKITEINYIYSLMLLALLSCSRCECMRDKNINQRLHKATLLKTLQVNYVE